MTGFNELLNADEMGEDPAPPATEAEEADESQDSQEVSVHPEKTVPLKALEDERGKRQGYESLVQQQQQQLDLLMRQIAAQQSMQKEPAPAASSVPDILLNPDEWQNRLFGAVESMLEQRTFLKTLALAEENAREKYQDYDTLIDTVFKPALARQPELLQGLQRAPDPAKYAYRQAKRLQRESEEGDMDYDTLKEKLRAEILAELEGKKAELSKQVKLPESLGNNIQGAAPGKTLPPGGSWRARDLYG